jgi:heme exporter protein A
LNALENLRFWRKLPVLPAGDAILLAALERVGLLPFADEPAGVFSRGMAQRLSLARLFLLNPSLVLLDEPLTGLDADSLAHIRAELMSLKAQGTALAWVTHTPGQELHLADALLSLHGNGRHAVLTPEAFSAGQFPLPAAPPAVPEERASC